MNNFQLVIGLEVHVVVNSITKMFSSSKSMHNDEVNKNINEVDLGLPGIMPQPNREVVLKAIALAQNLNMDISDILRFDRKNYFYQDLPKGYQITQQFNPIGTNGWIEINIDGKIKKINIERIHIEEDTAKQIVSDNKLLLDYNRAGMPLIEIVTKPEINSPKEASLFLKKIKAILEHSNISDAKLENGSMRADINISIMPIGSGIFGQRVEIKNINSISNVEDAINFEIERQFQLIVSGIPFEVETRKYDDKLKKTLFMRNKTTNIDYRYMVEPNILPIKISNSLIKEALDKYYVDVNLLYDNLHKEIQDEKMANHLFENMNIYKIYKDINNDANNPKEVYKWLIIEFLPLLTKDGFGINNLSSFFIEEIIILISKLKAEIINQKQAKELIKLLYNNKNITINQLIEENGFKQINSESEIEKIFENLFVNDEKMLENYHERPERVKKYFIGLIMKETKGQANPVITANIFNKMVEKYNKSK